MTETNPYSNPLAPSDDWKEEEEEKEKTQNKLSNSDFRSILMTPRVFSKTVSSETSNVFAQPQPVTKKNRLPDSNRAKKKNTYKQLKTEEEERNKELNEKYRDRARERRQEDKNPKENRQPNSNLQTTSNYTAVPPTANPVLSLAERRKEEIEKSQYLGGTLETTHNVKGLDKRFLNKIREEIRAKELEAAACLEQSQEKVENEKIQIPFKTALADRIMAALPKDNPIVRNELFIPGRMTFIFELDDPYEVIPTAMIRSKAECGRSEARVTLTNNDIVINKLIENFHEIRTGRGRDKKKKKDSEASRKETVAKKVFVHENIFDVTETEIGSYDRPVFAKKGARKNERKSYFEKPLDEDDYEEKPDSKKSITELVNNIVEELPNDTHIQESQAISDYVKKFERTTEIDCYAECYPGMMGETCDLGDSDDEDDNNKMNQGARRAPIGRSDFDNRGQHDNFMTRKETLSSSAGFQLSLKMGDGRSNKRTAAKESKNEFNKEWSKIQNMVVVNKRKAGPAPHEGMKKKMRI